MSNTSKLIELEKKVEALEKSLQQSRESEQRLLERESTLRMILDQSFQFILTIDTSGVVLEMNSLCIEVCGQYAKDTIGKTLWEADWWSSFPEVKEKTIHAIGKALKGETVHDQVSYIDKYNFVRHGLRFFTPQNNTNGHTNKISVIGVDISKQKRLENELKTTEERYKTLINNIPGVFYQYRMSTTGEFSFDYIAENCFALFGLTSATIISDAGKVLDLIPENDVITINKEILRSFKNLETYSFKHRIEKKDGQLVWVHTIATPRKLNNGEVVWDGIALDISNYQLVEIESKKRKDQLLQSQKLARLGYWDLCLESNTINWSDEVFTIFARDKSEFKPTTEYFETAIHQDDYPLFYKKFKEAIEQNEEFTLEHRINTSRGQIRHVRAILKVFKDDSVNSTRIMGTIQDITEEVAIRENLEKIIRDQNAILDNVRAYIYFKDTKNRIIKTTESVAKVTGMPRDQIEGRHSAEIYPDMADKYWLDDLEVIRSGKPKLGILESLPSDKGGQRWLLTDKIPYLDNNDQVTGVIVFATDVTKGIEHEIDLRASEAKFRSIFDFSGVAMFFLDLKGYISKVNAAAVEILGYPEKEILTKMFIDITHPDDVKKSKEKYAGLIAGKYDSYCLQKRYIQKNGQIVWGILTVTILKDQNGEQTFCIAQLQDVTERVTAVLELQKSEKQYRQMAERIPGMIYQFVIHHDGNVSMPYVNENIVEHSGLTANDVMKKPKLLFDLIHPSDRDYVDNKIKESAETMSDFQVEYRLLHPNGEEKWRHVRSSPVKLENGDILWDGIGLDITERKRNEQNLLRYKNMVSSTCDFVSLVDINYIYQIVNDEYLKLNGQTRGEIIGSTVSKVTGKDVFNISIKPHLDRCFAGEIITYQAWFEFATVGRRYYSVTYSPYLEDGVISGAIVNGRDITPMKIANDSVQKTNKELNLRGKIAQLFLTSSKEAIYQDLLSYLLCEFESKFGYVGYFDDLGDLICPSMSENIWEECHIQDKIVGFSRINRGGKWKKSHKNNRAFMSNGPLSTPTGHPSLKNVLIVPIQTQNTLIGQIALANKEAGYTTSDLERLENLARFISPILHIRREKDLYSVKLKENAKKLEQQNIALKVLLDKRSEEKEKIFHDIAENVEKIVHPFIIECKKSKSLNEIQSLINIIEENLEESIGEVDRQKNKLYWQLTTTEIKVVNLLQAGNSSKEIADMLNMSTRVVYFHRNNIRRKLGLHNKKINLHSYLKSI